MKTAGKGVGKLKDAAKINGSAPQNKGGAKKGAGYNKASGKAATKVSKVK